MSPGAQFVDLAGKGEANPSGDDVAGLLVRMRVHRQVAAGLEGELANHHPGAVDKGAPDDAGECLDGDAVCVAMNDHMWNLLVGGIIPWVVEGGEERGDKASG